MAYDVPPGTPPCLQESSETTDAEVDILSDPLPLMFLRNTRAESAYYEDRRNILPPLLPLQIRRSILVYAGIFHAVEPDVAFLEKVCRRLLGITIFGGNLTSGGYVRSFLLSSQKIQRYTDGRVVDRW